MVYVEMNDLDAYLLLVKRLQYYTSIVEIASVRENRNILQYMGDYLFEVESSLNSKLRQGDRFEAANFIKGSPPLHFQNP